MLCVAFSYMYFRANTLTLFSLDNEPVQTKGSHVQPLAVLVSADSSLVYTVHEYWVDLVFVQRKKRGLPVTFRQKNARKICTFFLWEELLFYTDVNDVWLCYPALHHSEPLKLNLASTLPKYGLPVHLASHR